MQPASPAGALRFFAGTTRWPPGFAHRRSAGRGQQKSGWPAVTGATKIVGPSRRTRAGGRSGALPGDMQVASRTREPGCRGARPKIGRLRVLNGQRGSAAARGQSGPPGRAACGRRASLHQGLKQPVPAWDGAQARLATPPMASRHRGRRHRCRAVQCGVTVPRPRQHRIRCGQLLDAALSRPLDHADASGFTPTATSEDARGHRHSAMLWCLPGDGHALRRRQDAVDGRKGRIVELDLCRCHVLDDLLGA